LAQSFRRNFAAAASTACMPFRIASAHHSHWLFHQLFMAEKIRTLNTEYEELSEAERRTVARDIATKRFSEKMSSAEERYKGGLWILGDLEGLLNEDEMKLAAAELMRQAEVLAWGTLAVLANDLFIELLNQKPHVTEFF
jgi:Asp-tRNA(Asn)/Glu-tRNA(Gln) amidotransferase B subunit